MAARTRSDEHGDRHAAEEAVAEAAKRTDTAQPQLTVTAANGFAVRALIDASADSDLLVAGTRGGGVVPAPEPWLHREPGSAPCTVPGCHSAARKLTDELRMEWRVRAARVGSADLNDEGPTGINRRAPTAPRSRVPSRLAHTWLCPHERIAVRGAASPSAASDSCAPTIAISDECGDHRDRLDPVDPPAQRVAVPAHLAGNVLPRVPDRRCASDPGPI